MTKTYQHKLVVGPPGVKRLLATLISQDTYLLLAIFPQKPWTDIQTFAAELDTPYFYALTGLPGIGFSSSLAVFGNCKFNL